MKHTTLNDRKQLFQLTWPIFLETVLFSIIGSVDTIMISRYAENTIGAVGVSNQILSLFSVITNIITSGTGILCAQYIGAGRSLKEKQPLVLGALMINTGLGLLFSLIAGGGADFLLGMMNTPPEQYEYARQYLSIVGSFLFLQMIAMTFTVVIRAHGKTRASMIFSIVMNLVNVGLNYVLIYGHLGMPTMGVSGAAVATVVSKVLACVMAGGYLFFGVLKGMSLRPDWKAMGKAIRRVLAFGAPAAGEQISYTLSKIVVMAMVTSLGAIALDAYTAVNTVVSYVYLFSMAIGQGTSIMIGWEAGRGSTEHAKGICRFSTNVSMFIALGILSVLVLVRKPVVGSFSQDPAVLSMCGAVILADFVLEAGRSRNLVVVNALRAAGDVRFPLYIGLFSMWFFSVGVSWVLGIGFGWGLVGIWLGLGLDECFRAVGMQIRWEKGTWTKFVLKKD